MSPCSGSQMGKYYSVLVAREEGWASTFHWLFSKPCSAGRPNSFCLHSVQPKCNTCALAPHDAPARWCVKFALDFKFLTVLVGDSQKYASGPSQQQAIFFKSLFKAILPVLSQDNQHGSSILHWKWLGFQSNKKSTNHIIWKRQGQNNNPLWLSSVPKYKAPGNNTGWSSLLELSHW